MKIATTDKLTVEKLFDEKRAATNALEAREKLGKLIDMKVMKEPRGPKRWRAAVELWLALGDMYVTPGLTAEQENHIVIKQNAAKRKQLLNKWGKSADKNSDLRQALCMPQGADLFVKLVDPEVTTKENTIKFAKEFKEYMVPEAL